MEEEDDHCPPDGPASRRDRLLAQILIPPPTYYPDDPGPHPGSILLDPSGYISDRTNGTTAAAVTKKGGGKPIQVTFWVAHPPRASYFTVYSPADLEIGDNPTVVTTEKDLALLRVPICRPGCNFDSWNSDYFVYQAGGTKRKPPTLMLVSMPRNLSFSVCDVGLLRSRRRGTFLIAILCWTFTVNGQYDLHLYSSETNSWSKRVMHIDSPPEAATSYSAASKVIAIGGKRGSVAWVDLWNGILIGDLLISDSQTLRYFPLPSPRVPKLHKGPPLHVRDITLIGGYIRYFEMCLYIGRDLETRGWEGAASRMKVSCTNTDTAEWEEGCRIKVCNDPTASSGVPRNLQKGSVLTEPVLEGLHSGFPAISLHDDDVVYIMDKYHVLDKRASVIAVDMKNQTIKGTEDFVSGGILGYTEVYIPSGISRYLTV